MSGTEEECAAVALDERYRWIIGEDEGARDGLNRPQTIGVGIDNGRTILDVRSWTSMPFDTAERLGYSLIASAAEGRLQQQRRQ